MRKPFLNRINILFGLASLFLAGCHSSKGVVKEETTPRPMLKYGVPAEVIAMYGVRVDYEPEEWSQPADTTSTDTVPASQPRPVMTKYGIPAPMDLIQ